MKTSKLFIFLVLAMALLTVTVNADMGPKPSVNVTVEGIGDAECYGTLLCDEDSYGPHFAWNGEPEEAEHNKNTARPYYSLDYEIWNPFAEYNDADGFYFLQEAWVLDEENSFAWTYLPPDTFKILLYFPDSGTYVSSGVLERYAFDSYFTVSIEDGGLNVKKSYSYTSEFFSLIARIAITIAIELGIAWLFKFTERKQLKFIALVNVITQIALNLVLNIINYTSGAGAFILGYIFFEFIVFEVETVVYCRCLNSRSEKQASRGKLILYALAANTVSFFAGIFIAIVLPAIF